MTLISIYYDCNDNTFVDESNEIIKNDVSELISYEELADFKAIGGVHTTDDHVLGVRYEIIFPINDINRTLYYDIEANVMYDEYGIIMFNIFSLVYPNDLMMFKKNKRTMEVYGRLGGSVELIWPECLP